MSELLEQPALPDKFSDFAREAADLAVKHGITQFIMTIKPNWRDGVDRRINGDIRVNFSNKDGRGRPCFNLSIDLEAHLTQTLVYAQPSSN